MMKKACRSYVSLLAIALVAVLVLSACGGSDEPTATPRPTATPVPETTAPEPAPTSAPTEPSAPTATPVPGAPAPAPTATPTSAPPPPTATPLPSFDAEAHFKGKTVRILVGFNPGGGTDTQARFLAAKWGQYIPGRPRIVISNLTPSLAANNFLFESEPNGLILIYNATAPIQSSTEPEAKFKASDFE